MLCSKEVKLFKENCKGRGVFIDNRKFKENDPITDLYNAVMSKNSTILEGLSKKYFGIGNDSYGKFLNVCNEVRVQYYDSGYISGGSLIVENPVN